MKKIGVYLGASPRAGGEYQYCLSILTALEALPKESYGVIAVYSDSHWAESLATYSFQKEFVKIPKIIRMIGGAFARFALPLWRVVNPYFHPLSRRLIKENCDLWIFPSQDGWAYQIPVPAVCSIHDLMHRYERRFPEIGEDYNRRERHFRNICRWTKGILVDSKVGAQHVMESYDVSEERLHILPFVPPPYITSYIKQ